MNQGNLILELVNAEGTPVDEPDCQVQILRPDQTEIFRKTLSFPPARTFKLPAFPQGRNLRFFLSPSNYRAVQSEFFTLQAGEEKRIRIRMMREPRAWTPAFTPWSALAGAFDPLKELIRQKLLKLKDGSQIGVVTPPVYDAIASRPAVLAKMALLNLFAVLTAEKDPISGQPWFRNIKEILIIDQERIIACVSSDLFESIDTICKTPRKFAKLGFQKADSSLHTGNFPTAFQLSSGIVSVKAVYEKGNVQLTVVPATGPNGNCHLLDCDMDEHHNLFLHGTDLIKHALFGGTHPVEIHDYIASHQPGVDLGYRLQPATEEQRAAAVV